MKYKTKNIEFEVEDLGDDWLMVDYRNEYSKCFSKFDFDFFFEPIEEKNLEQITANQFVLGLHDDILKLTNDKFKNVPPDQRWMIFSRVLSSLIQHHYGRSLDFKLPSGLMVGGN